MHLQRFIVLLCVCGVVAPIAAFDVDFYGSIGTGTWWTKTERFYANPDASDTTRTVGDSLPLMNVSFFPGGAVGMKFKKENFGGCIELGIIDNMTYDAKLSGTPTYMRLLQKKSFFIAARKWYGEWYAGDNATLLFGRDYTPANFFPSSQGYWKDNSFNNVGCLYTGRTPMFQVTIRDRSRILEGKLAVIQVDTTNIDLANRLDYGTKYICETTVPKFEGSLGADFNLGGIEVVGKAAGGFETYTAVCINENVPVSEAKARVDSWVAGLDVGIKLSKWVSFSFDMFYGQNIGTYGVKIGDEISWWRTSDFLKPFYPVNEAQVDGMGIPTGEYVMRNGKALEFAVIGSVFPRENVCLEGGWGTVRGTHDYKQYADIWSPTYAWYCKAQVKVQKLMHIAPEVGQFDWGPRGGFGRTMYFGVNAYIEFE